MVSNGIRLGAFDSIQWKHISPIVENEEVIAAKLVVYPGDSEEYFTFMTPEAYNSLREWMDYRAAHGEKITGESWIMRDLWQMTEMKYGANFD